MQFTQFIPQIPPRITSNPLFHEWLIETPPIKDKFLRRWRYDVQKPTTVSIPTLTQELARFHELKDWHYPEIDPIADMKAMGLIEDKANRHRYFVGMKYPARLTTKGVRLPPYDELLKWIGG